MRVGPIAVAAGGALVLLGAQIGLGARAGASLSPAAGGVHSPSAAIRAASVDAGTAQAGATLLGLAPGLSALSLTTKYGEATAAYEGTDSQASSATIDLGPLGLLLANTSFCGFASPLPTSRQPQPLSVDSEKGSANRSSNTAGQLVETVSADPQPEQATATAAPISISLPGIIDVTGRSQASVHYVSGQEQEADSSVSETVSILGGLVVLQGPHWTASQHSGTSSATSAGFDLGKVLVGGVPITPPNASTAAELSSLNTVLAPFGFTLILPTQTINQSTNTVSIGPMTLRFSGSTVERTLLSPVGNAVVQLEQEIAQNAKAGTDCTQLPELFYNISTNISTVLNVVLAIGQGAGNLDLDLGGATAGTQAAPHYTDPFGADGGNPLAGNSTGPIDGSSLGPAGDGATPSPTGGLTGGLTGGAVGSPATEGPPGSSVPAPTNAQPPGHGPAGSRGGPLAAVAVACQTTSPAGSPGCWKGLGTAAGGAALACGAGLIIADYRQGRRRPRPSRRRMTDD